MPGMFALLFIWGLGYCCSAFMKSLASTLKISLIILHLFKAIPTQKAARCTGLLPFAKGLGDDGHMKSMSSHVVGILLVYCTDLGTVPWKHIVRTRNCLFWKLFGCLWWRGLGITLWRADKMADVVLSSSQQRGSGLAWMMPGSPCSLVQDLPLS